MLKPVLLKYITTTEIKRFPRATKRGKGNNFLCFAVRKVLEKLTLKFLPTTA
jgi:hypothetical protein